MFTQEICAALWQSSLEPEKLTKVFAGVQPNAKQCHPNSTLNILVEDKRKDT